jgi:hypothetical protein
MGAVVDILIKVDGRSEFDIRNVNTLSRGNNIQITFKQAMEQPLL